ncbi:hypothetical protein [Streptomyces sp. NPDC001985]|uniref:hypothetical protein n=1 Tax=Streptomyces sp. NPDC001985 TaxID=3154406 RepID=UPI00332E88D5
MGGSPLGPIARTRRPTALLSAVATFLGALFICLGPAAEHHSTTVTLALSAEQVPAFSCPYDRGACGLLPVAGPAVLTAPPPDAPPAAREPLPRLGQLDRRGPTALAMAQPRAPDLYVLQVLRT